MSEILKDCAVVLKTYDFGESSIVAVALTREHGKIRLLAKGAKRSRSSFFGGLRTGNLVEIVYYYRRERGLQSLKEVATRSILGSGGEDLSGMCILQAGLEIVDRSVVELEADERMFDILEGFTARVFSSVDPWTIFFALEVQLLKILGFYPAATKCGRCNKSLTGEGYRVDPSSGSVTCGFCGEKEALVMSRASGELLHSMENRGYLDLEGVGLRPGQRREIGRFLHLLFLHHIDGYRLPQSLNLLKGVN